MKSIIYILSFLTLFACKQQESENTGYEIRGNIGNIPENAIVYLKNMVFEDSTNVRDGVFRFAGIAQEPMRVLLSVGDSRKKRSFWLENTKIKIQGTYEDLDKVEVIGGENQRIANLLAEKTNKILLEKEKIANLIIKNKDGAVNKDSLYARNKILTDQKMEIEKRFLKKHINTLEASFLLSNYRRTWHKDTINYLFTLMNSKVQNSRSGAAIKKFLELSKDPQIGEAFVDFKGQDPKGETVSLSQLAKGKYTLVDVWASWCAPCRKENPNLVSLYDEYSERGLEIVGVSLDSRKQDWLVAIEKDNLPWKHINDLKGPDNQVQIIYNIKRIPDNILIDEDGIIIGRGLIGDALKEKLEELFAGEAKP